MFNTVLAGDIVYCVCKNGEYFDEDLGFCGDCDED